MEVSGFGSLPRQSLAPLPARLSYVVLRSSPASSGVGSGSRTVTVGSLGVRWLGWSWVALGGFLSFYTGGQHSASLDQGSAADGISLLFALGPRRVRWRSWASARFLANPYARYLRSYPTWSCDPAPSPLERVLALAQ